MIRRISRYSASYIYRVTEMSRIRRAGVTLLASYPKCGRTWYRFILASYLNDLRQQGQIDLTSMFGLVPNYDLDRVRGIPAFYRREAEVRLPLIAATHLTPHQLAADGCPVMFMVRNPHDVVVSSYFHLKHHKQSYAGEIEAFVRDERHGLPSFVRYLNSWGDAMHWHPHQVVAYERLSAAPVEATIATLEFLDLPVERELVERAVAAASFEKLRRMEQVQGVPGREYDRSNADASRMRRGKVGGFRDYLDDASIRWIDDYCAEHLNPDARRLLAGEPLHTASATRSIQPGHRLDALRRSAAAPGRSPIRQLAAEMLISLGLVAALAAPGILLIEFWEWATGGEWPGWSVEDGLSLFGIDRGERAENSSQRLTDVLLALPLTFALFVSGVLAFLSGMRLGDWTQVRLRTARRPKLKKQP
ncbi:sulfotransferase domain-containing protein [Sphingomonas sp.]|uniref:sulfotransferase domain-containing protein n=1 Tax=Sphingomonas sp. TaxID=28214 RepID=UPI0031E211BB